MDNGPIDQKQRFAETVAEGIYAIDYTAHALDISIDAADPVKLMPNPCRIKHIKDC